MRLVIRNGNKFSRSKEITELQFREIAGTIKRIKPKSPYELVRGYLNDKLVIIYKDNRITRTKNEWYEKRVLTSLSKFTGNQQFFPNYKMVWKDFETEIDGVSLDLSIGIEISRTTLQQKKLDFLTNKSNELGFDKLIIVVKNTGNIRHIEENVQIFKFQEDWSEYHKYYDNDFISWKPFWGISRQRHFRFLLANGRWKPQRRRYTNTAKWIASNRLLAEIKYYSYQKNPPTKIYYSLSSMLSPLNEFEGRGLPLERFIGAFDVDGSHGGLHVIDSRGYCNICRKDARKRLNTFCSRLEGMGYDFTILNSGSKGFHVYLLDREGKIRLIDRLAMEFIAKRNDDVIDTFLSKKTGKYDEHRIFKVPYTIDCSTGILVSSKLTQISFKDELEEIKL